MQWQRYSRGFMLIILVGLLAGQSMAWGQQPKSGGTLTVGLAADIAHFDVFHAIGYEAYWALENIHSGLVRVDPQGQILPDMATAWDVKEDGRTYVFHLQKGVTFHDGTLADAEAIKWNIEYILDPTNSADTRVFYRSIAAVEVLDDTTLQIRLQEPSADFLRVLGGYYTAFLALQRHLIYLLAPSFLGRCNFALLPHSDPLHSSLDPILAAL